MAGMESELLPEPSVKRYSLPRPIPQYVRAYLRFQIRDFIETFKSKTKNLSRKELADRKYHIFDGLPKFLVEMGKKVPEYRILFDVLYACDYVSEYSAVVESRGFVGKNRFVLLKDICFFGLPLVIEEHVWARYNKQWEQIEPFFQNTNVLIYGCPSPYVREDGSIDYEFSIHRLIKLNSK